MTTITAILTAVTALLTTAAGLAATQGGRREPEPWSVRNSALRLRGRLSAVAEVQP